MDFPHDAEKHPKAGGVGVDAISPEPVALGQNEEFTEQSELRQGLKQRHIQMIALAGTVGTGLFLSAGQSLSSAGPLGAFLAYTLTGVLVAGMMLSVAELS